jgi:hypothetical protein
MINSPAAELVRLAARQQQCRAETSIQVAAILLPEIWARVCDLADRGKFDKTNQDELLKAIARAIASRAAIAMVDQHASDNDARRRLS